MASHTHKAAATACAIKCFSCRTRETSEWSQLQDADVLALNLNKNCSVYPPGRIVFSQGSPCMGIYCVAAGLIAIRKTDPNGKSMLVRLVTGGETLGYRTFFAGGVYGASAEALSDSRVCFIDKRSVQDILHRNPSSAHAFLRRMAVDLLAAEEARLNTVAMSTRARFASLLLQLRDDFGHIDDDGSVHVALPLSRQDTAAMLGTRPETLARLIRAFEDEGVAVFNGRSVQIPDIDLLLDEVDPHVQQ